jgi:hypothetical protein
MSKACSSHGENRNVLMVFVGKPDGKGPLGKPTHRWKNNIKMDWLHLAQDRALVNTVMNLQIPQNVVPS